MARNSVPATVLAQRGQPLTIGYDDDPDKLEVRVFFSFASLMRIEDEYGSLQGALEALTTNRSFTGIAKLLSFGLLHEEDGNGGPLCEVDVLLPHMDPNELTQYADAIGEAMVASFPNLLAPKTAPTRPPAKKAKGGRGKSGTTTAQSPSDDPQSSSGG